MVGAAAVLLTVAGATPAAAASAPSVVTTRVSVSCNGTQANSYAFEPAISGNGRYVAYFSDASNLVRGDTNDRNDVFVYDRRTRCVERVSVTSAGRQVGRGGQQPAISDNGRYVVFASEAPDLVRGDTNAFADIFVRDRARDTNDRVSVTSGGRQQTGGGAASPEISDNGRYVVYWSAATNLVPGDTNEEMDVFRYDRRTGRTERISVATDGTQGNARSGFPGGPDLSRDGRDVVFESEASNLVPNDFNGNALDVFLRDTKTGRTSLVSLASDGSQGAGDSYWPSISDDGRFVTFNSDAANLVPGDTNGTWDVFVRDLKRGVTTRVSVASDGTQGNDISYPSDISGNGRYVAFFSIAGTLVANDTNGTWDIFVHDRYTRRTVRASVGSDGTQANGASQLPSIADKGHAVVYESDATNLVRPDTNDNTDVLLSQLTR